MVETGPDQKMAKSDGNIFLLGEALDAYGAEAVVDFLLSGHYRQPLQFSAAALEQAQARNERVRDFFRSAERSGGEPDPFVAERREAFMAALADDFNTPRALAPLYEIIGEGNRRPLAGAHETVAELLDVLGLGSLAAAGSEAADPEAERLLAEREQARQERDFERADAIRDQLAALGWQVRDAADGASLVRLG